MPLRPEDLAAFAATHYDDYPPGSPQLFAFLVDVAVATYEAYQAEEPAPDLDDPASFAPSTLGGVTHIEALVYGLIENLEMRLPHLPRPQPDGAGPCQVCAGDLDDEVHRTAG